MTCSKFFFSLHIIHWSFYSDSQRGAETYTKQKCMFMSPVIFQILPMQFLLTNLWLLPKTEARLKNNQYPLKTLYMSEVLCAECYHLEFSTNYTRCIILFSPYKRGNDWWFCRQHSFLANTTTGALESNITLPFSILNLFPKWNPIIIIVCTFKALYTRH